MTTDATQVDSRLEFVVRKGDYFYRPKAEGYTQNIDEAGLFTELDAWRHSHPNGKDGPRDGLTYHLKSEFPSTTATLTAQVEALTAERDALRAEIAAKDAEIARLREALKVLQDLPIIENDKPNTLHLKGKEHTGEVVDYLFYVIRKVKEVARAAIEGEG